MARVWPPEQYDSLMTLTLCWEISVKFNVLHLLEKPQKWLMGCFIHQDVYWPPLLRKEISPFGQQLGCCLCLKLPVKAEDVWETGWHNTVSGWNACEDGVWQGKLKRGKRAQVAGGKTWFFSYCVQKEGDISGRGARICSTRFSFPSFQTGLPKGQSGEIQLTGFERKCSQLPRRPGCIHWLRAATTHLIICVHIR